MSRPMERRTLHFDLPASSQAQYTLHACLREYPLAEHTPEKLASARQRMPFLRVIPDNHITHFAELDLKSDAVALLSVTKAGTNGHGPSLQRMSIHVPQAESRQAQQNAIAVRPQGATVAVHPTLARYAVTPATYAATAGSDDDYQYPAHIDSYQHAQAAAAALVFHHRDLMNLSTSATNGAPYVLQTSCVGNKYLSGLALTINSLGMQRVRAVRRPPP